VWTRSAVRRAPLRPAVGIALDRAGKSAIAPQVRTTNDDIQAGFSPLLGFRLRQQRAALHRSVGA
jgi:hypothetical protein